MEGQGYRAFFLAPEYNNLQWYCPERERERERERMAERVAIRVYGFGQLWERTIVWQGYNFREWES